MGGIFPKPKNISSISNKEEIIMNTKILELNRQNLPIVKINRNLDKYENNVLFSKKVDEANNVLRTVGLPKVACL